ncbi:tetratricopeptide repeat protein [Roseimicrobium gellanilyticum]|uniref:Tetratricopeptide repeat protein n=1 Tax=Roseimicrobium gellanilyticum TaxID=748857 RepID=A0A366HU62_9BACT|nr:tetratricopeptide repeat protein [Roseimicrobium gellanilyticum]RBP47370.1 tetratricopeptide repeat protein [Roseimicrobium gellanilyticum]
MPRLPLLVLGWLLCSLALAPAQSGSVGGDVFFDGYQLWKQGEKLEQEGKKDSAIRAYLDAYRIISSVSQNYPEWQPDVVGYRLRIVVAGLQRLGYNVAGLTATAPAPVQQMPPMQATAPPLPVPPAVQPGAYAVAPQVPAPATAYGPGATPVDVLNTQFQQQQLRIQELERGNAKLLQDLDAYSRGYMGASGERDQLKIRLADLEKRMEGMNKAATNNDVATQQELQRLRSEAKIVNDLLSTKNQEFESLKKEKDTLVENQKKLTEEIEKAKKDNAKPEEMTKLIAENTRIKKELETAKAQVEKLRSEGEKKDQEIGALKTQITGIQSELAKLRQENTAYQTQVAELTMKYKEMSKELASASKPGKNATPEDTKAAEENKALRAIIMRQLRQQERARQAKELVIADMKKLENTSQTLMENLEDLTSGKIYISVAEESLFTEPELKEILAASGVTATLEARSGMATPPGAPTPEASSESAKPMSPPAPASASASTNDNGSSEETLMAAADSAILRSDYVAAEQSLQDALRINPKNSFALTSLAGIKLRQKKYEEAEVLFQKCLVYSPENGVAHYSLGVCYFRQNKLSDALNSFEKAVTNDRNNSKAHHYLGIIASNMSNRSRAEAEFKSALAIDPNYGDAHFNLAVLYVTSNPPNYEKARQHYQNALDRGIKPDTALERLLNAPGSPNVQTKSATASAQ